MVFFLFNVLPGDPAQMMLGQNESQEQLAVVQKKYGFDLPISKQYALYLNDLSPISVHSKNTDDLSFFSEDKYTAFPLYQNEHYVLIIKYPYLRTSYQKRGKKVSTVIEETLFNTLILALASILVAIILGISLGILATLNYNSWLDRVLQLISTFWNEHSFFFQCHSFFMVFWLFVPPIYWIEHEWKSLRNG